MNTPLEVLVVIDDSQYCQALIQALEIIPKANLNITVVEDERSALDKIKQHTMDLVIWDMDLSKGHPVNSIRTLQKSNADLGLIVVGGEDNKFFQDIIHTLSDSMLDCIVKSDYPLTQTEALCHRLTPNIRLISTSRNLRDIRSLSPNHATLTDVPSPNKTRRIKVDLVVIGISTGGPNALSQVISNLPEHLGVPILVVQHMPPVFTASLAKYLSTLSKMTIKEAVDGEPIAPDTIYIAPGGQHMVLQKPALKEDKEPPRIELNTGPHQNGCRPSVDVLLDSVVDRYGASTLVVIMTGMGKDGASGVAAIKKMGGYCITQSKESCVVYGMPRVIDELGLSDESVPLDQIADRIVSLTAASQRSART